MIFYNINEFKLNLFYFILLKNINNLFYFFIENKSKQTKFHS